jgi:hypothetical protein
MIETIGEASRGAGSGRSGESPAGYSMTETAWERAEGYFHTTKVRLSPDGASMIETKEVSGGDFRTRGWR